MLYTTRILSIDRFPLGVFCSLVFRYKNLVLIVLLTRTEKKSHHKNTKLEDTFVTRKTFLFTKEAVLRLKKKKKKYQIDPGLHESAKVCSTRQS